jgi:hypothetical protein
MIGYQHSTIELKDKVRSIKPDDLTIINMFESDYQLIKDINGKAGGSEHLSPVYLDHLWPELNH